MDVGRSSGVPAGNDGLERDPALCVRDLVAAQPLLARGALRRDVRVDAGGVAVPDVDLRTDVRRAALLGGDDRVAHCFDGTRLAPQWATSTRLPSTNCALASFTTRSVPVRPLATSTVAPVSRSMTIGTSLISEASSTTATREPWASLETAVEGISKTRWGEGSVNAAWAYMPAMSKPSVFGMRISVFMVSVAGSRSPAARDTVPVNLRPGYSRTSTVATTPARTPGATSCVP